MKSFNEMAESVLERRDKYVVERKKQIKKRTTVVSCFCLCAIIGIGIWQSGIIGDGNQEIDGQGKELIPTENYVYEVDEGQFSAYVRGKVIAEDKIGDKLADVTLTAGWKNATSNEWISQEKLRGEAYSINEIANNIAVALKFIDKGEVVTTTHYYVIINPNADLSAVAAYVIPSISSDNNGAIVAE